MLSGLQLKEFAMFKDAETPVIELLEQEPNENNMTISTEEETILVGEEQGQYHTHLP